MAVNIAGQTITGGFNTSLGLDAGQSIVGNSNSTTLFGVFSGGTAISTTSVGTGNNICAWPKRL